MSLVDIDQLTTLRSAADSLATAQTAEDELHNVVGNLEMLPMCDRGLDDMEDEEQSEIEDISVNTQVDLGDTSIPPFLRKLKK